MTTEDPRSRNATPDTLDAGVYLDWYAARVSETLAKVDKSALRTAVAEVARASREERRIWAAGNGGSAAISDHLCCDWTKGTHVTGKPPYRTQSLASNSALLTAIANDFSYDQCFSRQLEMLAQPGDVAILISSSGNSPNVVLAAETAKKLGVRTIALTGFSGGKLGNAADIHLHAPFDNYGIVEDCHQALMHVIAQSLFRAREAGKA